MGMDVNGKNPISETGKYFRNSCWYWTPLWEYCQKVAPEVCGKVKYGHSNDGDGLNAQDSINLSEVLFTEIGTGRTKEYEINHKKMNDNLPIEICDLCRGSGKRDDEYLKGTCNACAGKGRRKSVLTWYDFKEDNVKDFANFLRDSGGFEIW